MAKSVIGRAPEVSDDDIIEAGKMRLDQDARVTGFALRKAVGNRGDASRLYRVWNAYLETTRNSSNNHGFELSSELSEILSTMSKKFLTDLESMAKQMNATAVQSAEYRVRQAIKLAEEREQNAEAEVKDAMQIIEELEKQLTLVSQRAEKLDEEVIQLKHENGDLLKSNCMLTSYFSEKNGEPS
ncbi:DNA-binding protein [Vibrio parahaemolyticus]|uniref:DNA-binding protein n=1 Tax=Vibrio parahaemolyticus TaxID=670 RepID=UPI00387AFBF1